MHFTIYNKNCSLSYTDSFSVCRYIKMKFKIDLLMIFSLLILQLGVKAESSTLSIFNLIPNIIANRQFMQKNMINPNVDSKQTLPTIHVNLTFNANYSNCSRDIKILATDLTAKKLWALKSKFFFLFH